MKIWEQSVRILIKAFALCLLIVTTAVIWLLIDEPLDEETRRWLEPPPEPASATLDAVVHVEALAETAAQEDATKVDVDPDHRCTLLDRRCADYIAAHRERVLTALPQGEAYWVSYQDVLRSKAVSADLERLMTLPWQAYVEAVQLSIIRELATHGQLRPEFMAGTVEAQRRLLVEAPFLIDKMVFTATTGISFTALALAFESTPPGDAGFGDLVHAARPLSPEEVSLRRAMGGELRYMMAILESEVAWYELPFKRRHMLNLQRRILTPLVEESELTPAAFWGSALHPPVQSTWWDTALDPVGSHYLAIGAPAYSDYAQSVQNLEVTATVLRRWAATLSGEALPTEGATPEGLSHWIWRPDGESLCLEPAPDAPRATDKDSVCHPARPPS